MWNDLPEILTGNSFRFKYAGYISSACAAGNVVVAAIQRDASEPIKACAQAT